MMDIKWKKNSHILIHSHGLLIADDKMNIRRVCWLGRVWFFFKDWWSQGAETKRINLAIQTTLEEVGKEIKRAIPVFQTLNNENVDRVAEVHYVNEVQGQPEKAETLKATLINKDIYSKGRDVIAKISQFILDHLILHAKKRTPPYLFSPEDFKDSLQELPAAVRENSQADLATKSHESLKEIEDFFNLNFINREITKKWIKYVINKGSRW